MVRQATLLVLLVLLFHLTAKGASDQGKVIDRPGLARVETYCVETENLADDEALALKNFSKEEGKPKGMFKKLGWKRVESCQDSDATIKLEFDYFVNQQFGPRRGERDRLKGILRVYDNSTSRIIYTAEALPFESGFPRPGNEDDSVMVGTNLHQRRLDALRRVFSMLIHDAKSLPLSPSR